MHRTGVLFYSRTRNASAARGGPSPACTSTALAFRLPGDISASGRNGLQQPAAPAAAGLRAVWALRASIGIVVNHVPACAAALTRHLHPPVFRRDHPR